MNCMCAALDCQHLCCCRGTLWSSTAMGSSTVSHIWGPCTSYDRQSRLYPAACEVSFGSSRLCRLSIVLESSLLARCMASCIAAHAPGHGSALAVHCSALVMQCHPRVLHDLTSEPGLLQQAHAPVHWPLLSAKHPLGPQVSPTSIHHAELIPPPKHTHTHLHAPASCLSA
jgi:hypothetical protein